MSNTLEPTKYQDWQIAAAAETGMKPVSHLGAELGLQSDELIPFGRALARVDYQRVLGRLSQPGSGKYIDVTAITPTPLGEGKTTTTIGLLQGLGRLGHRVCGALRQPSGGPTFNIKGSAAGGGRAQCIPLAPFSLGLTGDIDRVTNAHNLAMTALTSRMQHEANYDDATLTRRGLRRLNIDPDRVCLKWAIDFCAQSLRNIVIGRGGRMDGLEMASGFQISVSSELMAILAVARDLEDMRGRIGRIVVAADHDGNPITTTDLEVAGAMAAWLIEALNPTLMQTIEGQPVLVHAGPFANIAIGQSSIIADQIGTMLTDYHVTESGFGADIGFEKFWNLKCRYSGMRPDAVVVVATIRALKMHGGGLPVKPGARLPEEYRRENLGLLEKGCENLLAHLAIVRASGAEPVVCINAFSDDTAAEINLLRRVVGSEGAVCVHSEHWRKGGEGAIELAEAVIAAANRENSFKFLYELDMPLRQRIELIVKQIYGGAGVDYSETARARLAELEKDPEVSKMGVCMVKTHLSLSHDPNLAGRPVGWRLPVRDILVYRGAGLVVPVAGDIKLLPGTSSNPAFRRIDVDVKTGKVTGLF